MGRIGRDRVADRSIVGVVGGGVDRDPIRAAGHAPHTTSQRADADCVVRQEVAVVCVGEPQSEGARGRVLRDGEVLAINRDYAGASEMGRIGRNGVADCSAVGVVCR